TCVRSYGPRFRVTLLLVLSIPPRPPPSPLFPTRRSSDLPASPSAARKAVAKRRIPIISSCDSPRRGAIVSASRLDRSSSRRVARSEEHTSELQSRENLVCRLLLEKKNKSKRHIHIQHSTT